MVIASKNARACRFRNQIPGRASVDSEARLELYVSTDHHVWRDIPERHPQPLPHLTMGVGSWEVVSGRHQILYSLIGYLRFRVAFYKLLFQYQTPSATQSVDTYDFYHLFCLFVLVVLPEPISICSLVSRTITPSSMCIFEHWTYQDAFSGSQCTPWPWPLSCDQDGIFDRDLQSSCPDLGMSSWPCLRRRNFPSTAASPRAQYRPDLPARSGMSCRTKGWSPPFLTTLPWTRLVQAHLSEEVSMYYLLSNDRFLSLNDDCHHGTEGADLIQPPTYPAEPAWPACHSSLQIHENAKVSSPLSEAFHTAVEWPYTQPQ